MAGTTKDGARGVSQKVPTSKTVGMDVLADRFNEHLPVNDVAYRMHHGRRVFVEKPGTGIYEDSLADLLVEFPQ